MTTSTTPPGFWNAIHAFVTRHRLWALVVSAGISLFAVRFAGQTTVSGDMTEYMPKDDPDVGFWLDLTRRFGQFDTLIIGLEEPSGTMSFDGLSRLARITDRLSTLKAEGVLNVRSVSNVQTIHEDEDGAMSPDLMIPSIPRDAAGLKELGDSILADAMVPGSLVSRDLQAYLLLVRADPRKQGQEVATLVREVVESERGSMKAYYFGAPFVSTLITREIYGKLPWLAPLFAIALLGVLYAGTRRFSAAFVVLPCAGLPLLWWLALLRVFGIPLTMAAANGALLLLVIAALVYARAAERRCRLGEQALSPGLLAGLLAPAAAFGGLAVFNRLVPASLPYLARFGEAMMVGMLAIGLVAVLVFAPVATWLRTRPSPNDPVLPPARLRPVTTWIVLAVLLALGLLGAARMRFFTTMSDMFMKGDEVGSMLAFFDRRFGGNDFVQIDVQGDLRDPGVAARVMRVTDLIEGSRAFADVRSITQILGFMNRGLTGVYRIPGDRDSLNNVWFFLDGQDDIRALVAEDRHEAMIVGRVPTGTTDPAHLVDVVNDAIERSAKVGPDVARARLQALSATFRVPLSPQRLDETLAAAQAAEAPADAAARSAVTMERLKTYMDSPSSPFEPTPEEWTKLVAALTGDVAGDRTEAVAAAIRSFPSYQALGRPEIASDLARTLARRATDLALESRSDALATRLFAQTDPAKVPETMRARARGVLADLVAAPVPGGDAVHFVVSGYPPLVPRIEAQLLRGLRASAAIVLAIFVLAALAVRGRRPAGALRAAIEAAAATALTFACGWALGINVDSGSATLYLLAPFAAFYLSAGTDDPSPNTAPAVRFPAGFALALTAAGLTLLLTGVLPIMRVGAVMALALALSVLTTGLSNRYAAKRNA